MFRFITASGYDKHKQALSNYSCARVISTVAMTKTVKLIHILLQYFEDYASSLVSDNGLKCSFWQRLEVRVMVRKGVGLGLKLGIKIKNLSWVVISISTTADANNRSAKFGSELALAL